jgi:hypothetical protein
VVLELSNAVSPVSLPQMALRWRQELSGARVVADHFPYGLHVLVTPRPYVYITVLRRPRERIVSYYRYLRVASDWEFACQVPGEQGQPVQSTCRNDWWPAGLPKNASVSNWLARQLDDRHYLRTHVDNYQVRVLRLPSLCLRNL